MDKLAELAGFFAAHGIWCVSESGPLVPMVAYENSNGGRNMIRFAADQLEDGVEQGRQWLQENPERAVHATLVFDGFITLEDGKTDALLCEAVQYGQANQAFTMAVPYRAANSPQGFAVFRPKFVRFHGTDPAYDELADAFFRGVDQHEMGAAVWNASLDQSR